MPVQSRITKLRVTFYCITLQFIPLPPDVAFLPGIRRFEDWTHSFPHTEKSSCASKDCIHHSFLTATLCEASVWSGIFFWFVFVFLHLLLPPSSHVCCVDYLCLPLEPNPTRRHIWANLSIHDHLQRCLDRWNHPPFSVRFGIDHVLHCASSNGNTKNTF